MDKLNNYLRQAEAQDVAYMCGKLRDADIEEIKASGYKDAYEALQRGFATASLCMVLTKPNEKDCPVAMFGIENICEEDVFYPKGYRRVWMLGTDEIAKEENRIRFLKHSRELVDILCKLYGAIGNYVYSKNTAHIRWIEWCGFKHIVDVQASNNNRFSLYVKEPE